MAQVARVPGQGRSRVVAVLNQGQAVAPLVGIAPACKDEFCGNGADFWDHREGPGAGPQNVLSEAFLCICVFEGAPGSAKGVLICAMCFNQ